MTRVPVVLVEYLVETLVRKSPTVPDAVKTAMQELNLSGKQELDLSGNKLTTLPVEIGRLTSLRKLILNNNELTPLPADIWNLTSLQELELSSNELTTLPAEIGNLTSLKELFLGYNKLTTLPAEIGDLTSLRKLELFRVYGSWGQIADPWCPSARPFRLTELPHDDAREDAVGND